MPVIEAYGQDDTVVNVFSGPYLGGNNEEFKKLLLSIA